MCTCMWGLEGACNVHVHMGVGRGVVHALVDDGHAGHPRTAITHVVRDSHS